MAMEFIKRILTKAVICAIIVAIFGLYIYMIVIKSDHKCGTKLTEFVIIDKGLECSTNNAIERLNPRMDYSMIMVLSFEEEHDTLNFVYTTFKDMRELCKDYIFHRNFRIIGYINKADYLIMMATDINSFSHMQKRTDGLIKPLNKTHFFEDLYPVPITKTNWNRYLDGNTIRLHYKYYNKEIQSSTTKLD